MAGQINKPVRVISCDKDGHTLHVDRLEQIFPEHIRHKRLIVVSINGNTGTGKSLMINLLASYFQHLENKTVDDWRASCTAIRGMSFEPPEKIGERTLGVFMWHKPFMISTDAGEVAILLADCQGSHGLHSGNANFDNAIQLLSYQLADVQLINVERIVNAIHLGDIKNTVRSMLTNGCNEFPDDLIFLCRNYTGQREEVYGEQPGAYMRAVRACDEEHQEALRCIQDRFKWVTTFTFPYPQQVAGASSNDENHLRVKDVPQEFIGSVMQLGKYIAGRPDSCSTGDSLIARFKALKEPVENGKLYEGLSTATNMRRDIRAMKDYEVAAREIEQIEDEISNAMDPKWDEKIMEERYYNETNRIIEDYDAKSITSKEYNKESLKERIKHGLDKLKKELDNVKRTRKYKIGAYAAGAVGGVAAAGALAATAIVCPSAAILGVVGLAEGIAGTAGGTAGIVGLASGVKALYTKFGGKDNTKGDYQSI